MPKYNDFALGLNNAQPADQIDDRELSTANNVEYNNSTNPEKREAIKTSELNDALSQLAIVGSVTKFKAWSPKVMPNDSYESYVYIIFTTNYEVYVIYKLTATTWAKYQLVIDNITYTADSVMSFAKAVDRIIITDTINKAHFVKIDEDGLFIEGVMEYPAPKYIPTIEVMTEYKDENFETNSEEGKLGDCGLYIYCWCYADKWLNLSNPSPFSDPVDRQFFSYDTEGDVDKWVESLRISNMKIPELDEDTKKNIKHIYLFRKYYKHTEDLTNIDWDLYNVYDIPSVDALNEFLDFSDAAEGQGLDYGNSAPVASQALAQGSSVFLAGCKTRDSLLWDFEWSFPIRINNLNNNIKVNKIYRIRVSEAIIGRRDGLPVTPFKIAHFFTGSTTQLNLRKLCFFAQDKTTPLKSMLIATGTVPGGSVGYFDAFIQIPALHPGYNIISFNFTTHDEYYNFEGIPEEFAESDDKYSYGKIFIPYDVTASLYAENWGAQTMFTIKHGSLENSRNIINCPMMMKGDEDNVLNRYDDEWNGVITDCTWLDNPIANIPSLKNLLGIETPVGAKSIRLDGASSKIVFGDKIDADNDDNISVRLKTKFKLSGIGNNYIVGTQAYNFNFHLIFGNCDLVAFTGLTGWIFGITNKIVSGDTTKPYFAFMAGDSPNENQYITEYYWEDFDLESEYGFSEDINLGITLSFNPKDKTVWLYIIDADTNDVKLSSSINLPYDNYIKSSLMKLGIGKLDSDAAPFKNVTYNGNDYSGYVTIRSIGSFLTQAISYTKNRTIEGVSSAVNLANHMHHTEDNKLIGYNWVDLSAYNNILIQEGYPIEYKDKNSVMWSSINSVRFKLANQKEFKEAHKIMLPAPYFITTEYGNSVLEITRNTINRINLSGTPDEWAVDSNNFIEEYSNLGALSAKGWGTFRDRVFGHTESGFTMWSKEEFRIISNRKVATAGGFADVPRIIVPMKTTLISFPNPLRNQYIWHDNETQISYVYHIDQDGWTLFTGLDIIDTDIIAKGENLENLVMMLTSGYIFKLYPDVGTYFNGDVEIKTKAFELNDNMIKKIIPRFTGTDADMVVTATNKDEDVVRTHSGISSGAIQYIQNGAWGHKFDIKFAGNLEKLYDIETILQRRF